MKESIVTSELINYLTPLNKCKIIKHAELATIGIPDLSITGASVTQWVEIKYVDYIRPVAFNLRKIVGWKGPQFRTVAALDYHGTGSFYVIFFHQPRRRMWHTFICTGVQCANYCNVDRELSLTSGEPDLYVGKDFAQIWVELQKRRREHDSL